MIKISLIILILIPAFQFAQQTTEKEYFENGKIKSEIPFADSIREGEAKFYYENGNLKEERNYTNGRVEGLVKYYNENGIITEMIYIENGKREGPTTLFDENGDYVKDIFFAEGKRVFEETPIEEITPDVKVASGEESVEKKSGETSASVKQKVKKNNSSMPLPPVIEEESYEDDPAFYLTVEVMPEPVGGWETVYDKIKYPPYAKGKGIEGTVKVLTFIDNYGEIIKAEVVEGLGYGMDEAARYAIYYTRFKPGLQKGKPVKVQMTIPIDFKLEENE